MPHRDFISAKLRELHFENCVIIDWGCGGKPITKYVSFGDGVDYTSYDKNPESEAHHIVDIEADRIYLSDQERADVAFCMEVLEHTGHPDNTLCNINEYLKPGGTLYLSVPFLFPKHHEEDYWRFTDTGITFILDLDGFKVEEIYPTTEDNQGWFIKARKV